MLEVQRLNMDNSWWIQWHGCNILLDPWLMGYEIDFFPWFNKQKHKTPPITPEQIPDYDVIIISQKYPDHFHLETLNHLDPHVPIIAPKAVIKKMKRIQEDRIYIPLNDCKEIPGTDIEFIFWDSKRKIDPIYDGFFLQKNNENICIATHGFVHQELPKVALGNCKWLLSPMNHYQLPKLLGGTVSPGIKGLEKCLQTLNPAYITATHDEDKEAHGLVRRFARIIFAAQALSESNNHELKQRILNIDNYERHII